MSKIIKKNELMLTTKDNPYDPFTQFNDWYNYDISKGYFTYSYLDRVVEKTDKMTLPERDKAYDDAMKEIVSFNPELYSIVSKEIEIDSFVYKFGF